MTPGFQVTAHGATRASWNVNPRGASRRGVPHAPAHRRVTASGKCFPNSPPLQTSAAPASVTARPLAPNQSARRSTSSARDHLPCVRTRIRSGPPAFPLSFRCQASTACRPSAAVTTDWTLTGAPETSSTVRGVRQRPRSSAVAKRTRDLNPSRRNAKSDHPASSEPRPVLATVMCWAGSEGTCQGCRRPYDRFPIVRMCDWSPTGWTGSPPTRRWLCPPG